jgi:hypothetical protein
LGVVHIVGESPTEEKLIIIDFAENLTYTVKRKENDAAEVEIIPLGQDNDKTMVLLDRFFSKPNKLVA